MDGKRTCSHCGIQLRRRDNEKPVRFARRKFCCNLCNINSRAIHGCGGRKRSSEYHQWQSMKNRCSNPKDRDYPSYGGRGITVCERWQDFATFLGDVGARPSPGMTLDRIDNNKGYEPTNVRWATAKDQARNRRNNVFIAVGGQTVRLTDECERRGLSVPMVRQRLQKGWDVERALNTPRLEKHVRGNR